MCDINHPYVLMTAKVPGKGKLTRIAIVKTTGIMPSRIDKRLKAVDSIYYQVNVPPTAFTKTKERLTNRCNQLNVQVGRTEQFVCPRCKGSGYLEVFSHVQNGVCYECDGLGRISRTKQWASIYPIYKECSPEDKEKIRWIFHAKDSDWQHVSAEQMSRIEFWLENGPLKYKMCLPPVGMVRKDVLLDSVPKPF